MTNLKVPGRLPRWTRPTTRNDIDCLEVDENCNGCMLVRYNTFRRVLFLGETRLNASEKAALSVRGSLRTSE